MKHKANTTSAQIRAMVNASAPIAEPPSFIRLRDCDQPFWKSIMYSRTRDEWTENDLVAAAQLARCQADIERESEMLDAEGSVVDNRANARLAIIEMLCKRELAIMRALRIGGTAAGERKEDLVKARKIQRQAEKALSELSDDELLAT